MIRGSYLADMQRAEDRVRRTSSSIVPTDWGQIEFVDDGAGVPFLLSHGIFGGHDNAVEMVESYVGQGFRTIGPSRFGYFGSSLPDGATPALQADAYIDLLEHLDLSGWWSSGSRQEARRQSKWRCVIPTVFMV